MAIHLSALKFVGLQLKKNIPYRVHWGWVRIHQKRIPRVVVLCEFFIRQKIGLSWFKLFKWNWTLPCHLIANDTSSSTVQLTLDWTLFASLAHKPESNIGREVKTTLTPILDIQRCEPSKYFLTLENTLPFRLKVPMRKRRRNAVHHPAQRVSCTL